MTGNLGRLSCLLQAVEPESGIGLERERLGWAIGPRTSMLVCAGSVLGGTHGVATDREARHDTNL